MALSRRGAAFLVVLWAMNPPIGCGLNPRPEHDLSAPGSSAPGADAGVMFGAGGTASTGAGGATTSFGGVFGAGGFSNPLGTGGSAAAGGPPVDAGVGAGGGAQGAGGASGTGGARGTLDAGSSDGGPDGGSTPSPDGATHGDAGDGG